MMLFSLAVPGLIICILYSCTAFLIVSSSMVANSTFNYGDCKSFIACKFCSSSYNLFYSLICANEIMLDRDDLTLTDGLEVEFID